MEFKHGPFSGLTVGESLQKIYGTYNGQTYADVATEFFNLIGGEENIANVEPHTIHKMQASGYRTFKISLRAPEETEFQKNDFYTRLINQFVILDFEDNYILAHCHGEYAHDMDLLAQSYQKKQKKQASKKDNNEQ